MEQTNNKYISFFEQLKRLILLHVDNLRLSTAEKLTILLSAIAIFSIVMIFVALFIVFVAMAIAQLLESVMAPFWAYMIVALFFLLSAVLFFAFRTELIVNPVSKFLSRLFVAPPKKYQPTNPSTSNTDTQS